MAATSPTHASSYDASAWDAADGSVVADYLSTLDDNDTAVGVVKQGKAPDDILRIEFPNLASIVNTDTVSVWAIGAHNYVTMALLPYNAAGTVLTTNKITLTAQAAPGGGETKFTLTTAFIGDLFDQGGGTWAARVVEDGEIAGDINISEIDSDLTAGAADVLQAQVWM